MRRRLYIARVAIWTLILLGVAAVRRKPTLISDKVTEAARRTGKPMPTGDTATAHAEVGTVQQAYDAGATDGADMTMTVNGENVCSYCRSDVRSMAERAGLRSLSIDERVSGNTLYWEPGMMKLRILP